MAFLSVQEVFLYLCFLYSIEYLDETTQISRGYVQKKLKRIAFGNKEHTKSRKFESISK